MEQQYVNIDSNFKPNTHWIEIWSLDQSGAIDHCMNFYDLAIKESILWAIQCLSQENSRSDTTEFQLIYAHQKNEGGADSVVRSTIPAPADDVKLFNHLKKFRDGLAI